MNFLLRILISSLAVIIVANILPGVSIDNYLTAILLALVLAFLNQVVKPLLTILTIPITLFTLGLFLLAINAFMILIAAKLVKSFHIDGFWHAMLFSIVLSIITGMLNRFFGVKKEGERENY